MKSILISIKPRHCVNILNGDKKIEVRTTATKEWKDYLSGKTDVMPEPIECLIYCTKQTAKYYIKNKIYNSMINGKVIAKFTLKKVEEIVCRPICGEWESYTETLGYSEIAQASCLKNKEIVHYLKGNNGYAWHISNLEIFDKPKELSEFKKRNGCIDFQGYVKYLYEPLTKAPQSWQFVESEK